SAFPAPVAIAIANHQPLEELIMRRSTTASWLSAQGPALIDGLARGGDDDQRPSATTSRSLLCHHIPISPA
ncbi:MAG TPA: hypothetical protein VKP69_25775, partial [Isosphaeraceae bacterium]|nr:hypothetical protein [Isosphaeraceae bacterium]